MAGQAWHWMDPAAASAEIGRVLRPGGSLAMAWNTEKDDSDLCAEIEAVQPTDRGRALADGRLPQPPLGEVEVEFFRWKRRVLTKDFIEQRTTHSAWMIAADDERAERWARWQRIAASAPEVIMVGYETEVWRCRR